MKVDVEKLFDEAMREAGLELVPVEPAPIKRTRTKKASAGRKKKAGGRSSANKRKSK